MKQLKDHLLEMSLDNGLMSHDPIEMALYDLAVVCLTVHLTLEIPFPFRLHLALSEAHAPVFKLHHHWPSFFLDALCSPVPRPHQY
jgi:hypothetical protein